MVASGGVYRAFYFFLIAQWTPPEATIGMLGQKDLILNDFWLRDQDNYGWADDREHLARGDAESKQTQDRVGAESTQITGGDHPVSEQETCRSVVSDFQQSLGRCQQAIHHGDGRR